MGIDATNPDELVKACAIEDGSLLNGRLLQTIEAAQSEAQSGGAKNDPPPPKSVCLCPPGLAEGGQALWACDSGLAKRFIDEGKKPANIPPVAKHFAGLVAESASTEPNPTISLSISS